jgi:regulatory protein
MQAPSKRDPGVQQAGKSPVVSLRERALRLLKRRDYAYVELERRLAPHAADPEELCALLEDLQRLGWLSEQRLAEQLVRKGAPRYGMRRLLEQLRERGIEDELTASLRGELQTTELERARAVWAKRFGRLPADLRERGRQTRFLEQRGFDHDVIRRILRGVGEE